MLKFGFVCLLLLNGALLAFQLGWFDMLVPGGHEPERLRNQINADKVRILSPVQEAAGPAESATAGGRPGSAGATRSSGASGAAGPASASGASTSGTASGTTSGMASTGPRNGAIPATPSNLVAVNSTGVVVPAAPLSAAVPNPAQAPLTARPDAGQPAVACIEIGNLTLAEGKRFEARLATLSLAQMPQRRDLREESSHMVWIPPQSSGKEGADKKSAELRKLGIRDFYVLQDVPTRYGISLGVFKTEEAAKARLAKLGETGVRSARVVEHRMPLVRTAFQFPAVDLKTRQSLDRLRSEFPRHEQKQCNA